MAGCHTGTAGWVQLVQEIVGREEDSMEGAKERMLRYLNDAYAVEEGGLASLRGIYEETANVEIKAAIEDHVTKSQAQIERLRSRIVEIGGEPNQAKGWVNTVIGKGSELLNLFHDAEDKLTQDLIKAYALEHFEIGMYVAMKAFANRVGDYGTAQLADSILGEEQLAAERLLRFIPGLAEQAVVKTSIYPPAAQ
jgi:ferritin-like metal-binding protein YciE